MKAKSLICAALLALAPTLALAEGGCGWGHNEQAMSCAEGSVWDGATQSCVPQTTS